MAEITVGASCLAESMFLQKACGGIFRVEEERGGAEKPLSSNVKEWNTPTPKKKNRLKNHEALREHASELARRLELNDTVLDPEIQEYIWKPSDSVAFSQADAPPQEFAVDVEDAVVFPVLQPSRVTRTTATQRVPSVRRPCIPTVTVRHDKGFSMVVVECCDPDLKRRWKTNFIGRGGRSVKQLEDFNKCSVSLEDFYNGIRITLRNGTRQSRAKCATECEKRVTRWFQRCAE